MFTYKEAYDDIIEYLKCVSNEFFEEYGTTREKVMADTEKLEELAEEHYKCVVNFGCDREWSCKDACESSPGFWRNGNI